MMRFPDDLHELERSLTPAHPLRACPPETQNLHVTVLQCADNDTHLLVGTNRPQ